MYLREEGLPTNVEKGLDLLRQAASWRHSTAAYNLGALYRSGASGVQKNLDKSSQFFRRAKELGCELPVDDYL